MGNELGSEIRRLRLEADITLRKFAKTVSVTAAHMSDIEHGRRLPSQDLLGRIAKALSSVGTTLEDLQRLDARLGKDLEDWVQLNPDAKQLLREVRSSGKPVSEILDELRKSLESDKPRRDSQ